MPKGLAQGITLLEILTTMAVGAISFGLVMPGMANLIQHNRLSTHVNNLRASLSLTRTNAIYQNESTVICKSSDGKVCSRQGEWSQGWIVYADSDHNRRRSAEERLIFVQSAIPAGTQIRYRAFGSQHYIAYRPTGLTRTNGSFTVCNPKNLRTAKALILNKSGRIRLSNTLPQNKPIKCEDKSGS